MSGTIEKRHPPCPIPQWRAVTPRPGAPTPSTLIIDNANDIISLHMANEALQLIANVAIVRDTPKSSPRVQAKQATSQRRVQYVVSHPNAQRVTSGKTPLRRQLHCGNFCERKRERGRERGREREREREILGFRCERMISRITRVLA